MLTQIKHQKTSGKFVIVLTIISLVIVLAASLVIYTLVSFAQSQANRPKSGTEWQTADGSAYLTFSHPDGNFGKITVDGKEYLVFYWCYPKANEASVRVVEEFSAEAIDKLNSENELYAYWDMTFQKDSFTALVTKSNFMEVGTTLTFEPLQRM